MVFGIKFVTQVNQPVVVDGMAGPGLAPSAYHHRRAIGFRRCSPKSRIRAELHKQKILRNR